MADMLWLCCAADGRSRWLLWTEIQKHTVEYMHPTAHYAPMVHDVVSSGTHGELRKQVWDAQGERQTPEDP